MLLSLQTLDVSSSLLHGTIDDRITALPKMVFFSVNSNYFSGSGSGSVPISSSNLLIRVYLDSNDFQGTVWAQLCHPMVGCYTVEGWLVAMTENPLRDVLDSVRAAEDVRSVGEV